MDPWVYCPMTAFCKVCNVINPQHRSNLGYVISNDGILPKQNKYRGDYKDLACPVIEAIRPYVT
jgi:hypothetical protein